MIGFIGVVVLMGGPSLAGEPIHIVLLHALADRVGARQPAVAAHDQDVGGEHGALMRPGDADADGRVPPARGRAAPRRALAGAREHRGVAALGYLFVFGSLIGFTAYNWLLRNARPVVATSYAYVNPILAVLFGAALTASRSAGRPWSPTC